MFLVHVLWKALRTLYDVMLCKNKLLNKLLFNTETNSTLTLPH